MACSELDQNERENNRQIFSALNRNTEYFSVALVQLLKFPLELTSDDVSNIFYCR